MATTRKKDDPFIGKVGNTVTYWLNGQWVKRTIGVFEGPPTVLQLAARNVLALIASFLKPVKGFIRIGFARAVKDTTLNFHNKATIENKLRALKGEYPDVEIDYAKAIFSLGEMPLTEVKVAMIEAGLVFSWDPDYQAKGINPTDRVMMIAYCPEKKYAFFEIDGARRKEGSDYLPLLRYSKKVKIHTYVSFISASRTNISTTVYTGEFLW